MDERSIMTSPTRLEIKRILNGRIERVWEYLTDGSLRKEWFCGGSTSTEPGGAIVFDFDHSRISQCEPPEKYKDQSQVEMRGRIIEYEKPIRLKFTWVETHVESSSTITILLKDLGEKTELHLIHEDLVPAIQAGVQAGWHAHLDLLLDLFNGLPARDFWIHYCALEDEYEAEIAAT